MSSEAQKKTCPKFFEKIQNFISGRKNINTIQTNSQQQKKSTLDSCIQKNSDNEHIIDLQLNHSDQQLEDSIIVGAQVVLTINDVVRVARFNATVSLAKDENMLKKLQDSCDFVADAVKKGTVIYGVTTGFGGKANSMVPSDKATELQSKLFRHLKVGTGDFLSLEDVRAAMLIRTKSHLYGASGIRLKIIERMILFLNLKITPYVHEFGSIGASGDLAPLAQIAGALLGAPGNYCVDYNGKKRDANSVLKSLNLSQIELLPKEGLAMVNGTSVLTATATTCFYDANILLRLTLFCHALMFQGLHGSSSCFAPFIHQLKPHKGQIYVAKKMRDLLQGSKLVKDDQQKNYRQNGALVQDRYSLRCLAQYLGPIFEGFEQIQGQIEVEINSVTDNPLFDTKTGEFFQGGNFLGQYIGIAMDQLRQYIALLSKHLDVQIGLLSAPEFNNGLAASLVGNFENPTNMGLKRLQICGNSIMPLLLFYGNSITDKFPTHAEQYNQNINSQGFNSANLARKSVDIFYQYISIALIFGIQSVDLRAKKQFGNYDPRFYLSKDTKKVYEAVREVVGSRVLSEQPLIWNDDEQELDEYIFQITQDLKNNGQILQAIDSLKLNF